MEDKTKTKVVDWIKVIRDILKLIEDGLSESAAVVIVATKNNLSVNEVKKHFKKK